MRLSDVRFGPLGGMAANLGDVRFSNRPVGVKGFQASTAALSMSLTGSRFSPESALACISGRGGTSLRGLFPGSGARSA
jgi:hypothetical protein